MPAAFPGRGSGTGSRCSTKSLGLSRPQSRDELELAEVVVVLQGAVHIYSGSAHLINQSAFEGLEEFFGSYERLEGM